MKLGCINKSTSARKKWSIEIWSRKIGSFVATLFLIIRFLHIAFALLHGPTLILISVILWHRIIVWIGRTNPLLHRVNKARGIRLPTLTICQPNENTPQQCLLHHLVGRSAMIPSRAMSRYQVGITPPPSSAPNTLVLLPRFMTLDLQTKLQPFPADRSLSLFLNITVTGKSIC